MSDIDVEKAWRDLEEIYSQMSEEELRGLADQAYELTDMAKQALHAQISSRGLMIELAETPPNPEPLAEDEPKGDLNPADLDLVSVSQVWDADAARRVMRALYGSGIPAYLGPENLEEVDDFHSSFENGVEIRVREVDQQRALRALASVSTETDEPEADAEKPYAARCPKCQSEEIVFRGFDHDSSDGQPLSQQKFHWTCDACGHEWEDDGIEEGSVT